MKNIYYTLFLVKMLASKYWTADLDLVKDKFEGEKVKVEFVVARGKFRGE